MNNRVTKLCLVLVTMLSVTATAFAQKTVTGTVLDDFGEPVIGANVVVTGTQEGTMTDADGNFTLNNVKENAVLKFTFMGYRAKEVKVNGQTQLSVTLEEDSQMLNEVVMVGYGVQRKSDVTGAVLHVDEQKLQARPVANAVEALQGKAAGVDITSNERPGELGSIRIRGSRSLEASNEPLYVVDGIMLQAGGIQSVNPADIKTIDILKDASSTAIYGSRGANGVILITTNRGEAGSLKLNYRGTVTIEKLKDRAPAMTASEYITWRRWAYYNSSNGAAHYTPGDQPVKAQDETFFAASGDDYAYRNVMRGWASGTWDASKVIDTDWTDFVTQTGITHEHNISASGGTEKMQTFASFGYLDNEGTQKGQEYRRYNFTVTSDVQAKPWFKMGGSVSLSYSNQDYGFSRTGQKTSTGPVDIYSAAKAIPRFGVPYDDEGNVIAFPCGSTTNAFTVIGEHGKMQDNRQIFSVLGNFYANVDFGKIWKPLEGLTYRLTYGPDFKLRRKGLYIDSSSAIKAGATNQAGWGIKRRMAWVLDNQVNYAKTVGDHSFSATYVHSVQRSDVEQGSMSEKNVMSPTFLWNRMGAVDVKDETTYGVKIDTDLEQTQMISYLGRMNYSYKQRYLVTVSTRLDGASVLGSDHKWTAFPSAALGWRMEEEEFLKDVDWIDQLKVRWSVGNTGNAAVTAYGTRIDVSISYLPTSAGNERILYVNEPFIESPSNMMPNPQLHWEKTRQYNYGIDFSVLNGRLGGVLDIYTSRTTDLILRRSLPTALGFKATRKNVGETKNFGTELTFNTIPVDVAGFQWSSDFNVAYQKDEIVSLSNGKNDDIANAWFIGESLNVYYGYDNAGLWQDTEEDRAEMAKFNANNHKFSPGMVRPVDVDGNHQIDQFDRKILGNKDPKVTMGWVNTFSWKGLELKFELFSRMGYMVNTGGESQYGMYNQRKIDYWRPDNTGAYYQKPIYSTAGGDAYSSLLGYQKASFIKLRTISLGYNVDSKICNRLGVNSIKIFTQAKNLGDLYTTIDNIDLDTEKTYYNRGFVMGLQIGL